MNRLIAKSAQCCVVCMAVMNALLTFEHHGLAQDDSADFSKAPPDHAIVSDTLNGWYFVPKQLKQSFDQTLQRLEALQLEIDRDLIGAAEATAELAELKSQLESLRTKIQASRVHVAGAEVHEQTETLEFELGPKKRLAITANHVRVVGWSGTKVKVELKKLVLSPDNQPVQEHLDAMQIVHEHGRAEFAGMTSAEWEAQEAEFMANQGKTLNAEQLAARRKLVAEIRQSYAHHAELLGIEIDQLSVAGLEYQNNPIVEQRVKSDGGDGRVGSVRQRYAEMTVYVPECTSVCVRGARRGLTVQDLKADLTIVDEDSTDSDARGRFEIHGLHGDLRCLNFPLQSVSRVHGHVTIESTTEFGVEGAGMRHHHNLRDQTSARPYAVAIHDVSDGVQLRFGRVRLDLRNIDGQIDVENEFGDTQFSATDPLARAFHRIVSLSGRIDVELSPAAWESVPVFAVTNHGGLRTNIGREAFEDFHLTGEDKHAQVRRSWMGFRSVRPNEDRFAVFGLLDRFAAVLGHESRSPGLDLLTRSGHIEVLRSQ